MSRRLESECVLWHECLAMVQSIRTCACGNHDGHMRRGLSRGSPGANPRGRCRGDCIRRQGPCLTGAEGRDDSGAHIWDNAGAHSVLFVKMAGGHACACALEYEWSVRPLKVGPAFTAAICVSPPESARGVYNICMV